MASINDLYNQLVTANATLTSIKTDAASETTATDKVNTSVGKLDTDLKAGFTATTNGLNTIAQIDTQAVNLLFHLTQQADAMICALEHISQNTCAILTQATLQTQLQTRLVEDSNALRGIADTVYPAAALGREQLAALRAEIRKCCPPPQAKPACTYEPCSKPQPVQMPTLPTVPTQPQGTNIQ